MTVSLATLLEAIDDELAGAVALRHELHAEPELGWAEHRTCARLEAALAPAPVRRLRPTGLVARLGGTRQPAVVVRAELDGLALAERTGVDYASTTGAMHACGHDVHMAALVCVTRALRRLHRADDVPFVALFQPSEEVGPSGARAMLDQVAEIGPVGPIGAVHVHPEIPVGLVAAPAGVVNASCDDIEIRVHGAGTHGAYPHRGRDPVVALAAIVVALQQVVSRRMDPVHGSVVSIGRLSADGSHNVIPTDATALGTLRAVSATEREALRGAVLEVVTHVAAAHGCSATLDVTPAEPALINDHQLAARFAEQLPGTGLSAAAPFLSCGSDDFAFYSAWGPLLMQFVGIGGAQVVGDVPLHDARFLPADDVIRMVAACAAAFYVAAGSDRQQSV
jgi:amidohydrolase